MIHDPMHGPQALAGSPTHLSATVSTVVFHRTCEGHTHQLILLPSTLDISENSLPMVDADNLYPINPPADSEPTERKGSLRVKASTRRVYRVSYTLFQTGFANRFKHVSLRTSSEVVENRHRVL